MYGASSSGMTIHFHYCCGQLENIDFEPVSKKCDMEGDHEMGTQPCCESQAISLQIEEDQAIAKNLIKVLQPEIGNPSQTFLFTPTRLEETKRSSHLFPPPLLKEDIIHLFCIYRI